TDRRQCRAYLIKCIRCYVLFASLGSFWDLAAPTLPGPVVARAARPGGPEVRPAVRRAPAAGRAPVGPPREGALAGRTAAPRCWSETTTRAAMATLCSRA